MVSGHAVDMAILQTMLGTGDALKLKGASPEAILCMARITQANDGGRAPSSDLKFIPQQNWLIPLHRDRSPPVDVHKSVPELVFVDQSCNARGDSVGVNFNSGLAHTGQHFAVDPCDLWPMFSDGCHDGFIDFSG
jgi:hypothetical protein